MNPLTRIIVTVIFIYCAWHFHVTLLREPKIPSEVTDITYWGPGNVSKPDDVTIRPFRINVSDKVLNDLKKRLNFKLRLQPPLENVNFEYGFNSKELRKIVEFWRTEYDWREREIELNKMPQFTTQVFGLNLHFIHAKPENVPSNVKVLPLLLLHGWPGSIKEFQKIIPLLTTPRRDVDFVFEVIAPSLPGFAFSEGSHKPGLSPAHMAVMFRHLMLRLGHTKFYVQGGDWGAVILSNLAVLYPDNVRGLHLNMCRVMTPTANIYLFLMNMWPSLFVDDALASKIFPLSETFSNLILETGYLHIQATKPDTIGTGLNNSPAGLAAYILEKFSTGTNFENRGLPDGGLTQKFSLPDLLDNVMLYWVTGSINSAFRIYAETFNKKFVGQQWEELPVTPPSFCAQFPNEFLNQPQSILRLKYQNLLPKSLPARDNPLYEAVRPPRGGHFAAMEEPQLLADSIFQAISLFRKDQTKNKTDL